MKLNFQQDVINLPGSVLSHSDATAAQLRVLLWLASDTTLVGKLRQLAKLADCSPKEAEAALTYWRERGILTDGESIPVMATPTSAAESAKSAANRPLIHRADELPTYTSTELAAMLEKRESLRILIDETQRMLGKIFNLSEVNTLVGMVDYLGMSMECILILFAHCKRIEKTSLRAIEKYAYSLVDRDITTPEALEEEIRTVETLHSFEGEVRALFGLKSRALTSKENKMLRAWVSFGYGIDVVRRAYELTVNATGEASLPYANSILERWNNEGLNSIEQIDRSITEQAAKKNGKTTQKAPEKPALGNSFDTDDFLKAALRRSYPERKDQK
ncbi:MAG: DnaD domain protein [Clostridia bacterium]|nr:DnaD domain protein [Clostridia bacterium]